MYFVPIKNDVLLQGINFSYIHIHEIYILKLILDTKMNLNLQSFYTEFNFLTLSI